MKGRHGNVASSLSAASKKELKRENNVAVTHVRRSGQTGGLVGAGAGFHVHAGLLPGARRDDSGTIRLGKSCRRSSNVSRSEEKTVPNDLGALRCCQPLMERPI